MQQLLEFSTNHVFLVSALIALIVLVVFNEIRITTSGTAVTPTDAITLINSGALVLDVRDAAQFDKGHIVNARNIPMPDLAGKVDSIDRYRNKPILVCCDTGGPGGQAAALLRKQSFAEVQSLQGGLAAWRRENLPLETEEAAPQKKKKRKKGKKIPAGAS
jgi:rhodanese-related sulfurtransferase